VKNDTKHPRRILTNLINRSIYGTNRKSKKLSEQDVMKIVALIKIMEIKGVNALYDKPIIQQRFDSGSTYLSIPISNLVNKKFTQIIDTVVYTIANLYLSYSIRKKYAELKNEVNRYYFDKMDGSAQKSSVQKSVYQKEKLFYQSSQSEHSWPSIAMTTREFKRYRIGPTHVAAESLTEAIEHVVKNIFIEEVK
jgi:hypothetical protein